MLKIRHIFIFFSILFLLLVLAVFAINLFVLHSTSDQTYENMEDLPKYKVALVLGTSSSLNGVHYNSYFYDRMTTAAKLYHQGKVRHFLLSGDNHKEGYNEPEDMKKLLVKLGVPKRAITLDYAGFRTLDSVVRARKVFGQDEFCIISQSFHVPRALYIANAYGIKASAAVAPTSASSKSHFSVRLREVFARCKAFLDLYIFDVDPKYLGEPIKLDVR